MKNSNIDTDFVTEITCEECHKTFDVECRTLIDTVKNTDVVNQVLDASWFTYTCPYCRHRQIVLYPCLYHDGLRHTLIAFADRTDNNLSYEKFRKLLSGKKTDTAYDKAISGWLENSTVRLTDDFSSFQEKVLLSVLGLDDRAVEAAKYINIMILEQQGTIKEVNQIYFNTDGSDWIFVIEDEKGEVYKSPLPKKMYEDVKAQIVPNLPDSIVVDQKWISACMHKAAN
jgi:hypothetical protein